MLDADVTPEAIYTPEEREAMIAAMERVSSAFYAMATQIGNHPFIEFCGLMNEYIALCRDANAAGIDFTQCSRHTGAALPIEGYQVAYLAEKLECIYCGAIKVEAANGEGSDRAQSGELQ